MKAQRADRTSVVELTAALVLAGTMFGCTVVVCINEHVVNPGLPYNYRSSL